MKIPALAGLACLAAFLSGCVITPAQTVTPTDSAPETYETAEQATEPPPPLPEYDQPPCPQEGWVWTPGVWRWGPNGYFWVPGTWVAPPQVGVYWTPGYWAFTGAVYAFHPGYWGPHVGYYGGINYGGGYTGSGFYGGRWSGNRYQYNTSVTKVNVVNVHNTYNQTVINNNVNVHNSVSVQNNNIHDNVHNNDHDNGHGNDPHASFVGGPGAHVQPPSRTETAYAREPRTLPTPWQMQHHDEAMSSPPQHAAQNQGRPPVAATPRPAAFNAHDVTPAKPVGQPYHPPQQHPPSARDDRPGHPDRGDRPDHSGQKP
jgi:hypothetical protein